jgi:hypothetical protein
MATIRQLGWFVALWAAGAVAVGAVAFLLKLWLR